MFWGFACVWLIERVLVDHEVVEAVEGSLARLEQLVMPVRVSERFVVPCGMLVGRNHR